MPHSSEKPSRSTGGRGAWSVFLAGMTLAMSGCGRTEPAPSIEGNTAAPTDGALIQQFAHLDDTVWLAEAQARIYQRRFDHLADELRRTTNRMAVLAGFPFERITLPRRDGAPIHLPMEMRLQRFSDAEPLVLPHAGWQKALAQFEAAGWTLAQFEWNQEQFTPSVDHSPSLSVFSFELHGEQTAQTNRFIVRGVLNIEWSGAVSGGNPSRSPANSPGQPSIQARLLSVTNLTILERTGPPGFSSHALIAPEPGSAGGQVNLHPLIVTDADGDQHDDIVLPGVNKALLNDGHAQFTPKPFIRDDLFNAMKEVGLFADFTGDGHPDYLSVADLGPFSKMLVLYRGQGSIPLEAEASPAWQAQLSSFEQYHFKAPSALAAGDVDGDGDIDVFLAQYRPPYVKGNMPAPYYDANDGYPSYLLLNDGQGHFNLGVPQPALEAKGHRRALAASMVDLDNDNDLDLVTLNDFSGVDLFYNNGHGIFTDETGRLDHRHLFGMGQCFADFNHDGALDILAIGMDIPTVRRLNAMGLHPPLSGDRSAHRTEMAYGNRLYLARDGRWIEPPWAMTLARTRWSWGTSAFDMNNDGQLDVYIANGHVSGASSSDYDSLYWTRDVYFNGSEENPNRQRYFDVALRGLNSGQTSWNGYQHNALFVDIGTNDYLNAAYLMGVAHETDCRAVVAADMNEDGRPDLLVTEALWQGSPNVMRHQLLVHLNQIPSSAHWIGVRLLPSGSGGSPIGAKVLLRIGSRTRVAQIVAGDSFQSQAPNTIHFGLGPVTQIDDLKVVWADGKTNALLHPALDRYHPVQGRAAALPAFQSRATPLR